MFSVEDLLVSHGYKVSKNSSSSYQPRSEGYQQDPTDSRTGNGLLNGYQADPEVFAADPYPLAKGFYGDSDKSCANRRRQLSSTGNPRGQRCLEACHTSETGLSDKPQNERAHWAKAEKDIQYWRRRGQDFSLLLGQGTNEEEEKLRSSTDTEAKLRGNIFDKNSREAGKDLVEDMETVRANTVYDNWKPSLEEQWGKVNKFVMKATKTSERTMSESSGEKMLQDFISFNQVDNTVGCPNKLKSLSLPKGLSPDSINHISLPAVKGENYVLKEDKTQLQSNCAINSDSDGNSSSKQKYSRPSNPPSYEVHQQTWGAVDTNEGQDHQQKDEHHSIARVQDLPQESCFQDSGLEPPNYIPPPSYKYPPLQHATNQSFNKVPSIHYYRPNNPVAKTSTKDKSPTNSHDSDILYDKPAEQRHTDNYIHSIQYIPFDDPRIKHIPSSHEAEKPRHNNHATDMKDAFRVAHASQEGHLQDRESAFIDFKSAKHNYGKREGIKHKQWMHISIPSQICCSLPETREGSTACSLPENSDSSDRLTLKKTHSDSACEIITKVKKFEPEACLHNRKSSKRKLNETIFCLVSIPIKSDSAPSDMCKNNKILADNVDRMNMLKHSNGGLFDERLLSASSSDLELQTLTGNMNNKAELGKQDQSKTEGNKQANDLRCSDPRKHRELAYSGSWPGDQYKDQQTQTVFGDIQNSKYYNETKANELHNNPKKPHCGSEIKLEKPSARQNMFSIKGQMSLSPSSNSAFSRTSLLITHMPKTEPCQRPEHYNENGDIREKIATGKYEKKESESESFCNKKEVFGQFLLKPVNRRPWDAISELECLNKEFQEQENCSDDGDRSASKEQSKESQLDVSAIRSEMVANKRHVIEVEEVPVFEPSQVKCMSDSWYPEKLKCDKPRTGAELKSGQVKDSRGKSEKSSDGCVKTEKQVQNKKIGTTINLHTVLTPNVEQKDIAVQKNPSKIQIDKNSHAPESSCRLFRQDRFQSENSGGSEKSSQVDIKAIRKLSPNNGSPGLSVFDLNQHFITANHNGEFHEPQSDPEIPETESLHERATRILGIDVADDSLVSTGSSEAQSPENLAFAQNEAKLKAKVCEIKLSTKESPDICNSVLQPHMHIDKDVENFIQVLDRSFISQPISLPSEVSAFRNCEKKVRNTSKMIETLQGKLASTPPRTAVDRLARMKEVDSVSRMRRLSIKSTDSGDEIEDEKLLHRGQDVGSRKFSAGAIYKRVISLDESLLITTKSKEKLEFSFSESYDPTRVERV
ncbi:junctional protein associated with coronary artery disease [Xenopus laevis]|uniref:Junctional protein associated with coronary artery disease n=2 Tax=Xenopus laevis TaxID=8355 RepID=A0A1L8FVD4_XENLA|nr:junctional protein associated with coronary artery disease [Xenopus laevis]OCT75557.1 hypothetical protein XELAEV_18030738mg [Xenopus laevis]